MRLGKDEKPECSIAEKYEVTEDGCVYTFSICAMLSGPMESCYCANFAYAWKKVIDPKSPSDQAFQLRYQQCQAE